MKIAILQPLIPHYREAFFKGLEKNFERIDIYIYQNSSTRKKNGLMESNLKYKVLKSFTILNKILFYNLIPFLTTKYDVIILPGELRSISTWLLLIIFKIMNKKVILWGHGISVVNYMEEEKELKKIRILFHKLANRIWLYTEKEKKIWSRYIEKDKIIALNNSVDTNKILNFPILDKNELKNKYKINTNINLIYCARFTQNRRIDLMIKLIEEIKDLDIGLIIIGEGEFKPDFSKYPKVYDFKAVYDEDIKHELFSISDFYFQPAWTGLSIVEAMAYGKPILTFERTKEVLQCVEYGYIIENINGKIFTNLDNLINYLTSYNKEEILMLSKNTRKYAIENLTIENMINKASNSIKEL